MNCDNNNLISVEQALTLMFQQIKKTSITEKVPLNLAINRVLASDIVSQVNNPPHNNSAMDGYALSAASPDAEVYHCVDQIYAGKPTVKKILSGQCARIMTGAVVPETCDRVVMQENIEILQDGSIKLRQPVEKRANIRFAGEDIAIGDTVLKANKKLSATDIGLLATLGISEVQAYKKIKVGILTTGDELKPAGSELDTGQIYDSNRPMLLAFLQSHHFDVEDLGIVADDPNQIRQAILHLAQTCDAIVTSGGVSVGDADYTGQVLQELGTVGFWKLAMKPGKPFSFGRIEQCYFFGLPGNPVSAAVTFEQLALKGLSKLAGLELHEDKYLQLPLKGTLKKRAGRQDYQRGILLYQGNCISAVCSAGMQSSGALSALAHSDCLIVIPREEGNKHEGDIVNVIVRKI
ncbi:molybdopterin molybdotransferase MoeA [Catenovulum sediminis]|uniref:Molybdopterin molybdenumtransferase n=1 Tax=Catenovulum sediminis TaxID=1740262 RepID=A0ABV1RI26_9ALTE